jgi:transcriptional regulator with GAF, ATPase, and Fis domain
MDQPHPRPAEWISSGQVDEATAALLRELLRRSAQTTGAANTALWLAGETTLAAVLGTGPHAEHFVGHYEQAFERGIISLVFASGQPLCENAIASNPDHSTILDSQLGITSDAMIAVPITALGEIAGVLTCVHTRPAGSADPASRFRANDLVEFEFAAACVGRILDAALLSAG